MIKDSESEDPPDDPKVLPTDRTAEALLSMVITLYQCQKIVVGDLITLPKPLRE
jgi:hypothetical protein